MRTSVRVLSDEEQSQVHERSLRILGALGVRVDSQRGRRLLAAAGAQADEGTRIVRFPRDLVEESLRLAPRTFSLGGRRTGWDLPMNAGHSTLMVDGEAIYALDAATRERRHAGYADWQAATDLIDAVDEVGVYWRMIEAGLAGDTPGEVVHHWGETFRHFSKHVQDSSPGPEQTRWLLEVLQVVFGDRAAVRRSHPFSFLLCPLSPLVLEGHYTDAYLETAGWDIPVAVMPMPMMGLTSPVGLLSTIVQGNAEVLAALCLVQAAAPGTPFLYAPALAVMEPRTGRFGGGAPEHALLGAAATEMARFYGLPVEASTGSSDDHVPGIQASYERALNWTLPALAWPDILVGPGLLGGSMILSLEQLIIDLEVFRRLGRLHRGIGSTFDARTEAELAEVGPGGSFLSQRATRDAVRSGEWHISQIGVHDPFERWVEAGRPELLDEAHEKVSSILAAHEALPLDESVERELRKIERRAREARPQKVALVGTAGEAAVQQRERL